MRPLVVVELDPVANDTAGMLQSLEAVAVDALLLQRPDHPLQQAVLLRGVGRDEFLLQAIAFDQRRVTAAGEDQAFVRAQQEGLLHASQAAETGDQGLLQRRLGGARLAARRDMPAQQLPAEAVDHQCQCGPAITASPDAAQARRPTFVGLGCP